jgi:CBS domain containing-hemolysin-like protein
MVTSLAGIAAVVLLTVATGYFVAQEFAFVTADRARLAEHASRGEARAERALRVMSRLSFMLSGAQLGITVTALVVGFIAEPATSALIKPALNTAGLSSGTAEGIAVVAGFVIATVIQMVLGELLPKNLALARAEPLAKSLASSTLAYLRVAGPVIRLFDAAAIRLLRVVGVEPVEELHHGATLEELGDIIGESRRSGHLPADLSALLQRSLTFGARTAAEVMVPRPDVITVPGTATAGELTDLIAAAGHTHYPVYGRDIDDVLGTAGVREIIAADPPSDDRLVTDLMRPALLIPDTLPLQTVITRMREAGEEFAGVVDEYGGLAGILTFEDIAEELVGEIADENDAVRAPSARAGGVWELDGAMRIAQVRDLTGIALPTDPAYDSLSGLIMAHLSRLPQIGDSVQTDLDPTYGPPGHAEIQVLSVRRRVARSVRLQAIPRQAGSREERAWTP